MAWNKKEQTISNEVFQLWTQCRKHGDNKKIAEALKVSQPVIERALNFGAVYSEGVEEGITNFFLERAKGQNTAAEELKKVVREGLKTEEDETTF
jgi:hypothetical protein